jgi:hypothetical protein
MHSTTDYWNEREFMAFLLLYASKADAKTTDEEVKFIVNTFGADAYDSVLPLFSSQSDYENIQTITSVKERFYPGTIGKVAIREHLVGLFEADGHYSSMEKVVMNALERLFD